MIVIVDPLSRMNPVGHSYILRYQNQHKLLADSVDERPNMTKAQNLFFMYNSDIADVLPVVFPLLFGNDTKTLNRVKVNIY